jgi:hypothetical protein
VGRREADGTARIVPWHRTKGDVPQDGIPIDATAPVEQVVDAILRRCDLT